MIDDLDELIRYENESTRLDFKAVQYTRKSSEALLKDLMAMANANVSGDRYIVIGVKHRSGGAREFLGISEDEFTDSAVYHQIARENIEPEIHFTYEPYRFDDVLLGVFRVYDCTDPPYMMRKQFGPGLRSGDAYIRKGTHQARVTRPDLDRILRKRIEAGFTGELRIGFEAEEILEEISLPAVGAIELPSQRAAETIRAILEEREKASRDPSLAKFGHLVIGAGSLSPVLGPTPYARRSNEELRKNLEHVKDTYRDADLFTVLEQNAVKINLMLLNEGDSYVEDASVHVTIPKTEGLVVADKIYTEPESYDPLSGYVPVPAFDKMYYPQVKDCGEYIEVVAGIGDLRHGIPTAAFEKPLRLFLGPPLIGTTVRLECTVHGKQLREPRMKVLSIAVLPSAA